VGKDYTSIPGPEPCTEIKENNNMIPFGFLISISFIFPF
tara:strand:- start:1702 stop:1818 length:117 start_codon:yes stop_codon:yes gene_type:complete